MKKFFAKKYLIVFILIIVLILIMIGMILFNKNNMFLRFVNTNLDYMIDLLEEDQISGGFSLKSNSRAPDMDMNGILSIVNDFSLNLQYGIDFENSFANLDFSTKYKDESFQTGNIYIDNDKIYLMLDYLLDNYLELDVNFYQCLKLENRDDFKQIFLSLKDSLNIILKEIELDVSNEVIDGKKFNMIKISAEDFNHIKNELIYLLKEDGKFVSSLSNILDIDSNSVLNNLDELNDNNMEYEIVYYKVRMLNDTQIVKITNVDITIDFWYSDSKYNFYFRNLNWGYRCSLKKIEDNNYQLTIDGLKLLYTLNFDIVTKDIVDKKLNNENINKTQKYTTSDLIKFFRGNEKFDDIFDRYDNRNVVEKRYDDVPESSLPDDIIYGANDR